MASKYFEAPEWELEADEAKEGAKYLKEISKHYNHAINPLALLWVGFIFWIITTYGTRGFATYSRVAESKDKKKPFVMPPPKQAEQPVQQSQALSPSQLWNEPPIDNQ